MQQQVPRVIAECTQPEEVPVHRVGDPTERKVAMSALDISEHDLEMSPIERGNIRVFRDVPRIIETDELPGQRLAEHGVGHHEQQQNRHPMEPVAGIRPDLFHWCHDKLSRPHTGFRLVTSSAPWDAGLNAPQ